MVLRANVLCYVLVIVLVHEAVGQLANFASPRVQVADGKLRGKYMLTRESKKIRAFLGIPYAKPPVGELRFKSPERPTPWEKEAWAVDHPKACVQPDGKHGEPIGREDCLYLNVYSPDSAPRLEVHHTRTVNVNVNVNVNDTIVSDESLSNEITTSETVEDTVVVVETKANQAQTSEEYCPLLPVMVFFHGGAFETGHSEHFTHEYLTEGNVVLVTVQYRLGLLGFLSTGDDVLPGNLGFKDQRLALKWVQENIEHFGGSPDKVTIFGDGAGGAAVHYHMLFSQPKFAFFRAGISMSGTALSPWAFRPPSEVKQLADNVAHIADCPRESQEFLDCLLEKPAEELVVMLQRYKNQTRGGCGKWSLSVPVLGGVLENSTSEDGFITANPWDKKVSLPWIVGVTSKEMLYEFTSELVDRNDKLFKQLDKCFDSSLAKVLGYSHSVANEESLGEGIRKFYFKGKQISRDIFAELIDAVSDGSVVYPAFEAVRRAGRRTTWLYSYNFIGTNTYGATALDGRIAPGRGDDLFLFFPRPLGKNVPRKNKDLDTATSRKLVKLWTNFATSLDPTPTELDGLKWISVAPSTTFLNISQDKMKVERPFNSFRMNFWSMQSFPNRDDDYGVSKPKQISQEMLPNIKQTR